MERTFFQVVDGRRAKRAAPQDFAPARGAVAPKHAKLEAAGDDGEGPEAAQGTSASKRAKPAPCVKSRPPSATPSPPTP